MPQQRGELTESARVLLSSARRAAIDGGAAAVMLLAEQPTDVAAVTRLLEGVRLIVASDRADVCDAAREHGVAFVPLSEEPRSRHTQLTQALLEAIADDLIQPGDRVVAVYAVFERSHADTTTLIHLREHLAKLTARDLQRLETTMPLETLRHVVDLAVEIGAEGREGKPVGTLFVVGHHRKVLRLSHEQIFNPFRGYPEKERQIRSPRVRECVKELAQLDGAFVLSAEGVFHAAGRILNAGDRGIEVSPGLGSRHVAAAAISHATQAVAVAVSQSTGTVRIFQGGAIVLRIEPMRDRGMRWSDGEPGK